MRRSPSCGACIWLLIGNGPTVEDLVRNDLEFHSRIAACSRNVVLASLLDSLCKSRRRVRGSGAG